MTSTRSAQGRQVARVELAVFQDELFDGLPVCALKGFDSNVALRKGFAFQKAAGVGKECPVDEPQADVIGHDPGQADTRAHVPASGGIKIGTPAADWVMSSIRRDFPDNVMDFEENAETFFIQESEELFEFPDSYHDESIIT